MLCNATPIRRISRSTRTTATIRNLKYGVVKETRLRPRLGKRGILAMGKPLRDLSGQRFGFLAVLRSGERQSQASGAWWLCRCDCGIEKNLSGHDLVQGKIRSCGCQHWKLIGAALRTHGMKGTRTYRIWQAMLNRCRNEKTINFKDYGGRGIVVCDRWKAFEQFFADMGEVPTGHSIDRIDNDGNYEPGNCRWASREEQSRNQRSNVLIEFAGERLPRAQWERRFGMRATTLRSRLRSGKTLEEAMRPLAEGNTPAPAPSTLMVSLSNHERPA
jgi:hypothetical protein